MISAQVCHSSRYSVAPDNHHGGDLGFYDPKVKG